MSLRKKNFELADQLKDPLEKKEPKPEIGNFQIIPDIFQSQSSEDLDNPLLNDLNAEPDPMNKIIRDQRKEFKEKEEQEMSYVSHLLGTSG